MKKEALRSLSEIEEVVLTSFDIDALYRCDIELRKHMTELFLELEKRNSEDQQRDFNSSDAEPSNNGMIDKKGQLSLAEGLLQICVRRQDVVGKENLNFNRKFREAAKLILSPKLYDELSATANQK